MPNELRLPNGLQLLEHTKAVRKIIFYEHLHVTREGQLRTILTPELKVCCLLSVACSNFFGVHIFGAFVKGH